MPDSPLFTFNWNGTAVGVNHRYVGKSKKILNPAYRQFKYEIAIAAAAQTSLRNYADELTIVMHVFIDKARDADSLVKPILDSLELRELNGLPIQPIIQNDNQIRVITIFKHFKRSRQHSDSVYLRAWTFDDVNTFTGEFCEERNKR